MTAVVGNILCVLFVSCNRPDLLNETVSRVVTHIRRFEPPDLRWESVLVDQVTPEANRSRYPFDARVYSPRPRGYGWPFNVGYAVCRAPYVAVFEDDWFLDTKIGKSILMGSIQLLQRADGNRSLGVLLRSDHRGFCGQMITIQSGVTLCIGNGWGSYTNGPAVYDMARLGRLGGPQAENEVEASAAERMWSEAAIRQGMGMLWTSYSGVARHMGGGGRSTREATGGGCK